VLPLMDDKIHRIWFSFSSTGAEVGRQETWGDSYLEGFPAGIFWVTYFVEFEKVWPFKLVYVAATIWKPNHDVVLKAYVKGPKEIGYIARG
jgi:hypothetical protein